MSSTLLLRSSSSFLGGATPIKPNSRLYYNNTKPSFTVVANKKVYKIRKVILKENLENIGKKGQLIKVRAGFFRNYLLPFGKAQLLTPEKEKEMQLEEERINAEKRKVKEEAEKVAQIFESVGSFMFVRKAGEKGKQIFGTITNQDIVDLLKEQLQRDVDKRIVSVPDIRETGVFVAEIKLHPEVIARIRINVVAK